MGGGSGYLQWLVSFGIRYYCQLSTIKTKIYPSPPCRPHSLHSPCPIHFLSAPDIMSSHDMMWRFSEGGWIMDYGYGMAMPRQHISIRLPYEKTTIAHLVGERKNGRKISVRNNVMIADVQCLIWSWIIGLSNKCTSISMQSKMDNTMVSSSKS